MDDSSSMPNRIKDKNADEYRLVFIILFMSIFFLLVMYLCSEMNLVIDSPKAIPKDNSKT
ncbi:hypothetical protein GCM10007963_30880 [Lutibacter litoralis]|nr:hypothetical protein GCM10007963_30880 [Lutibacter litoralis]